jgi:hypothetical protein
MTTPDGRTLRTAPESLVYLDRRFDWVSATHGAIRTWTYDLDADAVAGIARDAAAGLESAARHLDFEPTQTVQVVAYRTAADMRPALLNRGGEYESRLTTLGARVAPDIVLLLAEDNGGRTLAKVLAHELAHVALHLRFDEPYADAPLWLDEGFAMYNEGALTDEDAALLAEVLRDDRLLSIRSLTTFPGDAELVPIAYVESRDLVAYLFEAFGAAKFHTFLDHVGGGELTDDEALRAAFGHDRDSLYRAYRSARGRGPPRAATPTPRRELAGGGEPTSRAGRPRPPVRIAGGHSSRGVPARRRPR